MSYSKACCSIPAVTSTYEAIGSMENIGDLPMYTVGPKVCEKSTNNNIFCITLFS